MGSAGGFRVRESECMGLLEYKGLATSHLFKLNPSFFPPAHRTPHTAHRTPLTATLSHAFIFCTPSLSCWKVYHTLRQMSSSHITGQPQQRAKCPRNRRPKRTPHLDFKKLPTEIRLQIWRDTIESQHVVVWQNHQLYTKVRHHFGRVRIPIALHVCRESRNEILPYYSVVSLDDAEAKRCSRLRTRPSPKSYVNFELDTFVFAGYDYLFNKVFEAMGEHSQMIKSLAFSLDIFKGVPKQSVRIMQRKLPYLSAIYIHVGDETQHHHVKIYDPCRRHIPEVWTDSSKLEWNWSQYMACLEKHIAQSWGSEAPPLKGIVASDDRMEADRSEEATFDLGELRGWMKEEVF